MVDRALGARFVRSFACDLLLHRGLSRLLVRARQVQRFVETPLQYDIVAGSDVEGRRLDSYARNNADPLELAPIGVTHALAAEVEAHPAGCDHRGHVAVRAVRRRADEPRVTGLAEVEGAVLRLTDGAFIDEHHGRLEV